MSEQNHIRVRIAPSPTGFLHIGTARSALFNWLFARKHSGVFIVRIEDTDRERSKKEFESDIIEGLAWLGIKADELYRQSERLPIYTKYIKKLLDEGKAFLCAHSIEELEQELTRQRAAGEPPKHFCADRDANKTAGIIRFKNESRDTIIIKDIIRGEISFHPGLLGDFSLARSIDEPLYNFANVVDDYEMKMTHIIRGEDHISNTPKQILVGRALEFAEPKWAHLPLLLGEDRSKLSKRHGALSVNEYRKAGYLPEAMLNFIVLLGWHPASDAGKREQEFFSSEEMIDLFSLERVQKGGAIVAAEKLDWFNKEYIKRLPLDTILERAHPYIPAGIERDRIEKIIEALRTRITRLSELPGEIESIINPPPVTQALLSRNGTISNEKLKNALQELARILGSIDKNSWRKSVLEEKLSTLIDKEGRGNILWPLRAALSGREASAGPYELAEILGQAATAQRLNAALACL